MNGNTNAQVQQFALFFGDDEEGPFLFLDLHIYSEYFNHTTHFTKVKFLKCLFWFEVKFKKENATIRHFVILFYMWKSVFSSTVLSDCGFYNVDNVETCRIRPAQLCLGLHLLCTCGMSIFFLQYCFHLEYGL